MCGSARPDQKGKGKGGKSPAGVPQATKGGTQEPTVSKNVLEATRKKAFLEGKNVAKAEAAKAEAQKKQAQPLSPEEDKVEKQLTHAKKELARAKQQNDTLVIPIWEAKVKELEMNLDAERPDPTHIQSYESKLENQKKLIGELQVQLEVEQDAVTTTQKKLSEANSKKTEYESKLQTLRQITQAETASECPDSLTDLLIIPTLREYVAQVLVGMGSNMEEVAQLAEKAVLRSQARNAPTAEEADVLPETRLLITKEAQRREGVAKECTTKVTATRAKLEKMEEARKKLAESMAEVESTAQAEEAKAVRAKIIAEKLRKTAAEKEKELDAEDGWQTVMGKGKGKGKE